MSLNEQKKVYNYQKRFTYIEAPLYSLIIAMFVASWLPMVISFFNYGLIYSSTIRFGVFMDFTIFVIIGIIFLVRSEMKKSMFLISEDVIVARGPGKLNQIFFSDLVLCKHVQGMFSEHVRLTSPDKTIELPFSISGIHDLILTLNERIITANKSDALEEASPGLMISSAFTRKNAYAREKAAFFPLIISTLLITIFNIFIGLQVWELDFIPVFMWAVIGFIIPMNVFTLGEMLINNQMKKTSLQNQNSGTSGSYLSSYIVSALVFLVLYLCAGIAFKTFF